MTRTTTATNALAQASSAYLRSAMHQPIRWHEWGADAFDSAQRENKPILLDIGAVWCHWCHVMDRESYDSPEVAKIINDHFIAVKVDRDERPEIDSRYQAAVSAISGQGGWPLTAFLTPDGRPFFGGTYFPPEDRYGRSGFKTVLLSVARAYREKHQDVLDSAASVVNAISQAESFAGRAGSISPQVLDSMVQSALGMFDPRYGGFGSAPKFQHASVMDLIIDRYSRSAQIQKESSELKTVIVTTLERMARGGVYDQLAGGFHRYSVDEMWLVPHFEKMAYDNSELLKNYVRAYQATGEKFFAYVATDIIRWMDEWLSDRERGGFYGSQDADISLDDDGDYFTWTQAEARAVLNPEEAQVALAYFGIEEHGQMHHNPQKNVLHVARPLRDVALETGIPESQAEALLESAKKKMYAARLQRPTPYIDKTVYVSWNGLCISAYLEAAKVLELADARSFALRSLDRILEEGWKPEAAGLGHVIAYSDPGAARRQLAGVLDDYAFTAIACLDAYEITTDLAYFRYAKDICDAMISRFYDEAEGGFFDIEKTDLSQLGVLNTRRKALQDSPTPAGNPAAVIALMRLFNLTNDAGYREKSEVTLKAFAGIADQYGMFTATYGIAVVLFSTAHIQVIITGEGEPAKALHDAAMKPFALNKSVLWLPPRTVQAENLPPALAETIPYLPAVKEGAVKENKPAAIICSGFACQPAITSPGEVTEAIERMLRAPAVSVR